MNTTKYFAGVAHSLLYQKFRFQPPAWVFEDIVKFVERGGRKFDLAVDVGCGTGQACAPLSRYFSRVVGIDESESQINMAAITNQSDNVAFRIAQAKCLPFKNNEVDLVTTFAALHYFNLSQFFSEVDRILVPGGGFAVFLYVGFPPHVVSNKKSTRINELINIYENRLYEFQSPDWLQRKRTVLNLYNDLQLPYAVVQRRLKKEEIVMSLPQFTGFMKSYSAYQNYLKFALGSRDLLEDLYEDIIKEVGIEPSERDSFYLKLSVPMLLILCRKPH